MSSKFDETSSVQSSVVSTKPTSRRGVQDQVEVPETPAEMTEGIEGIRVKLPLASPLDYAVAQLYRNWPKPRERKDN